jgi:hypothetical protein
LARENQGENYYSDLFEGCPAARRAYTDAVGIHHFEPGSRLRVYRATPQGPERTVRPRSNVGGTHRRCSPHFAVHWKGERWGDVNRGRVASLDPRNGCGESVGLSKRIQDQTGVRKIGDKDSDKAGGKGEGSTCGGRDGSVRREYIEVRDGCAWNGSGDTRNEGLLDLKFEEFWNWWHADNGLVCRNVDAIIALRLFSSQLWT